MENDTPQPKPPPMDELTMQILSLPHLKDPLKLFEERQAFHTPTRRKHSLGAHVKTPSERAKEKDKRKKKMAKVSRRRNRK